jgi:hypothetical protein
MLLRTIDSSEVNPYKILMEGDGAFHTTGNVLKRPPLECSNVEVASVFWDLTSFDFIVCRRSESSPNVILDGSLVDPLPTSDRVQTLA